MILRDELVELLGTTDEHVTVTGEFVVLRAPDVTDFLARLNGLFDDVEQLLDQLPKGTA